MSSGAQAVTEGPSVSTGNSHGSISRDGRCVAFDSLATNLDPSDTLAFNVEDVFLLDRLTGVTTLESASSGGAPGNSAGENPAISADGRSIGIASFAANLVGSDTNFAPDIFVRRRATSTTQSHCTAGTTSDGCAATIRSMVVASATANSGLTLTLGGIDGQRAGLVFYGLSGVRASPWGTDSSWLCVRAPTQRMTTYDSGGTRGACDGSIVED